MKRNAARLASSLGIVAAARELQAGQTAVLTYHGVLSDTFDADDFLDHNFVSASAFASQIDYVCEHYEPVSIRDLAGWYLSGRRPPRRAIAITFDDGFANNYSVAFPILRERGVPFTVFVTTGMVGTSGAQLWTERVKRAIYLCQAQSASLVLDGRPVTLDLSSPSKRTAAARAAVQQLKRCALPERDAAVSIIEDVCGRPLPAHRDHERYEFLTWEQIRALAGAGVEIGSHTVNHPILSTLDDETLETELQASKASLERELGRECRLLAYPNGSAADYGAREKRALNRLGYECAFSLRGTLNGERPDRFEIDRININRAYDDAMFPAAVAGLLGRARRTRDWWASAVRGRSADAREVRV